jgi:hypothetical protein
LLCALLLVALRAHALEPIDTDGPDFVESSEVVPKGHFQYEVDMTSVRNRRSTPHSTAISTPTLLTYGAADNIEVRIAPEGYVRQDGKSGLGDTALGLKWHAQDRDPSQVRRQCPGYCTWRHPQAPLSYEETGSGRRYGQ